MKILGLDIATKTGFSILEDDKLLYYGTIILDTRLEHRERFKIFKKEIRKILNNFKPSLVIVEATYSGPNPKTTAYLNMLRGIAIESIPKSTKVITVSVSTARKDVLGSGKKHDKLEVFNWIVEKFGLKDLEFNKHNDISDSMLISFWGFLQNS